jgi:hypothetical protein
VSEVTLRLTIIESNDGGEWHVTADSRHGRARIRVAPPYAPHELDLMLLEVTRALERSASPVVTRRSEAPARVAQAFGKQLTRTLMSGHADVIFDRCRNDARAHGGKVRVLLNLDGPRVSRIPWEFATDPQSDDFLALRVSVARAPDVGRSVAPAPVQLPLRVLCVQSSPEDLDPLDAEAERARIAEAFARVGSDKVQLTWMPGDRWHDLAATLRAHPWHVLHFVGHGGYDRDVGHGFVVLTGDDGRSMRLSALDLGRAVAQNESLRLVVLNACDSAIGGSAADDFASTAETVLKEGVPAVLAMQYEISDRTAAEFSAAFYAAIAAASPVDEAVTLARNAIKDGRDTLEWATPVLFLASEETRIFDVDTTPTVAVARLRSATRSAPDASTSPDRSAASPPPPPTSVGAGTPASGTTPGTGSAPSAAPPGGSPRLHQDLVSPPLGSTHAAALGPRGLVAMLVDGRGVRVWSTTSVRWAAHCRLPAGAEPWMVAWSPWPRHLATANADGTVVVWDLETEVPVRVLRVATARVRSIAFSNDGLWLVVTGADRSVRVFDSDGRERTRFEIETPTNAGLAWFGSGVPGPVAFTPDDRHLLVATNDGAVTLLSRSGQRQSTWPEPLDVTDLACSRQGLVTRATDGRVRIWRWDGRLVHKGDESAGVEHVAMDQGGYVAAVSRDGRVDVLSPVGRVIGSASAAGRPVGVGAGSRGTVTVTDGGVVQRWVSPLAGTGGAR